MVGVGRWAGWTRQEHGLGRLAHPESRYGKIGTSKRLQGGTLTELQRCC